MRIVRTLTIEHAPSGYGTAVATLQRRVRTLLDEFPNTDARVAITVTTIIPLARSRSPFPETACASATVALDITDA